MIRRTALILFLSSLAPAVNAQASFVLAGTAQPGSPADVAMIRGERLTIYKQDETELRAAYHDENGALISTMILQDLVAGDRILRPVIGTIDDVYDSRFVIAWEVDEAGASSRRIEYTTVELGAFLPGPVVTLADTSSNDIHIALSRGDQEVTMVWEEEGAGIRGAFMYVDSNDDLVQRPTFDVTNNPNDHKPAVAMHENDRRLVVWHRDPVGNANGIWGRHWPGDVPNEPEFAIRTATVPLADPECDASTGDDFFVVWSEQEPTGTDHDIRGRRVFFPYTSTTVRTGPIVDIENTPNDDEVEPKIRYTGNAYIVGPAATGACLPILK